MKNINDRSGIRVGWDSEGRHLILLLSYLVKIDWSTFPNCVTGCVPGKWWFILKILQYGSGLCVCVVGGGKRSNGTCQKWGLFCFVLFRSVQTELSYRLKSVKLLEFYKIQRNKLGKVRHAEQPFLSPS